MSNHRYKIAAIAQINNEIRKGNLERFFTYLKPLVDDVVVYDDASTDGSWEYARDHTPHVIRGTKNNFVNEWQIKQLLVAKALELKPDFILLIDADEVLSGTDQNTLQRLADWVVKKDLDGALIQELNLWRSRNYRRTDSDFGEVWFSRFWRVRGVLTYSERSGGLHQSPAPDQIRKIKQQDMVSFLHFGFESDEAIAWKYLSYANRGQRGEDLARFISEEKFLTTAAVDKNLYPNGLWQDDKKPVARSVTEWYRVFDKYRDAIKKPNISIVCLIYQSTEWLQFVYDQVLKYTDLKDKEFYFVANDATPEVKKYLHDHYIPHYVFENTDEQKKEWYINNVYRAWNYGAKMAKGDLILFINSDMSFSPNWVEELLAAYNGNNCVAARLIERNTTPVNECIIKDNFGDHFSNYQEGDFLSFIENKRNTESGKINTLSGGPFMPLLIKKDHFEIVGGYPEGNMREGGNIWTPVIATKGEPLVPGDVVFMRKLAEKSIVHETALNAYAYHFQEGEMRDVPSEVVTDNDIEVVIVNNSLTGIVGEQTFWNFMLDRLPRSAGVDMAQVEASERNFTELASTYIAEHYPNARFIIQNATFIDAVQPTMHTISLLQDNLRRMNKMSLQQEETLELSHTHVSNSTYTAASYPEYAFDIIPLGLNEKLFTPRQKEPLRDKYGIDRSTRVGIFVGALSPVKGWDKVRSCIEKHPEITWLVVTKDKESYRLLNVKTFSQIPQETLAELYSLSDFFIIGSPVETQCLAALEANLSGLPVIMHTTGIYADFTEKERLQCGIFGDNFEEALENISVQTFNPRDTILQKGFTIDSMIDSWWHLIAAKKLVLNDAKPAPLPRYSWQSDVRRRMKMLFSKTFLVLLAKKHLTPRQFAFVLKCYRNLKKLKQ